MFKMIRETKEYSEEDILRATKRLRAGDHQQVIPLIKMHITLSNKIAGFFTRNFPHRREDLYAEGFRGLCKAINKAQVNLVDDNITAYAASSIKGAIQHYLCHDCLIPIPRGEFKKRMEQEDVTSFMIRTTGGVNATFEVHDSGVTENIAVIVPLTNKVMEEIDIPCFDRSLQRMEDLYQKMRLTEEEIKIVDMRLDGCTLEEIGATLGMTKMAISYKLTYIKVKIQRLGIKTLDHTRLISGTKECSRCHNERSLSFFYKIGPDSYKSICKICMKEQHAEKVASVR